MTNDSSIKVEVHGKDISPEAADSFRHNAAEINKIFANLAEEFGVPWCEVTFILAEDYAAKVAEIEAAIGSPFAQNVSTDRVGGVARAKAISMDDDSAQWCLVFDPFYLVSEDTDPLVILGDRYVFLLTMCHEVAHVLIGRTRAECGFSREIDRPSKTACGKARNFAMAALEEYRADALASAVLGLVLPEAAQREGESPRRFTSHDLHGDSYGEGLVLALSGPLVSAMCEAVADFRSDVCGLNDAVVKVWELSSATLTLFGHAQAIADEGGRADALRESLAGLNNVADSIARAWAAIVEPIRSSGVMFTLDQALTIERALAKTGERAVLRLWEELGIECSDTGDGIWVEPVL